MLYRIFHPDDSQVCFLYDDGLPQMIRKIQNHSGELLPLRYENVNVEDFFFCIIKAKVVHIEDRNVGFAYVNDQRYVIARPYDCKWALNRLFDLQDKNPLIKSDKPQQRYLWTLNDIDMQITQEEWHQLQRAGHLKENNPRGFSENDFTQRFSHAQKAFANRSGAWQGRFDQHVEQTEEIFDHASLDAAAGFKDTSLPDVFIEQQKTIATQRDAFHKKKGTIAADVLATAKDIKSFPEEELQKKFSQKQEAQPPEEDTE